ncbi:MAG: efflux RND transporter periplasmic adaptor subunit [Muribaculaceae bacterium]|nr:efflux RND transporter periplasmic adaptor subunit [Muribaculaceae bacterium]
MKKSTFILSILIIAALFTGCRKKEEQATKQPIRVETEVAMVGANGNGISYVGVVEESEATAVSFTTMGVIKRMLVDEGQMVSRGQLLAEIDASTSNNGVEIARATTSQAKDMVKQAEDTYAQAKDAYDRMKVLHDNGSLPEIKWVEIETRLKQAENAVNTARMGVVSAQATEKIAHKGVADTRLIAPVSGVIGRKQLDVGETALPSQSVVSILNINTVKIKVSIPENELKNIGANTRSTIFVEAINKIFNGGRIEKGIQADVATHTYDIRIIVANPGNKLLPGMVASVVFPTLQADAAANVYVPITAVQRQPDGGNFVWVADAQKKAHRKVVKVGPTSGNRIAILEGLNSGDRIITSGNQKLSEGSEVVFLSYE